MIDPAPEDRPACRHCGRALGHRDFVCPSCRKALRQGLEPRSPAALDAAHDLEALASVLRVAADQGVDFCLALRTHGKDSLQVVSSMELRQGRFW